MPTTLTIASPAPPAPKFTGAEMAAAATLLASAPLVMVSVLRAADGLARAGEENRVHRGGRARDW